MKRMNTLRIIGLSLIALILVSSGCDISSRDEVQRAKSPDGSVDAILYESNGGATTSFAYEIELLGRGSHHAQRVASLYGATRNQNAYGVNLRWSGNDELRIEYLSAIDQRVFHPKMELAGRSIQVVLKSGIEDHSAPSGGMYYNLQARHPQ